MILKIDNTHDQASQAVKSKLAPPSLKYSTNSFCILGLPATAPASVILQRVNETKIYAKLGSTPKFNNDINFILNSSRTEEMIRISQHALENSKTRLQEELFWFWDEGIGNQNAFHCLAQGKPEEAEMLWIQIALNGATSNEKIVAKHNEVILRHACLLKQESDGYELDDAHWNKWHQTLKDWMDLIAKDDLWNYVAYRAREIDGALRPDLVESLRKEIFEEVLQINEDLIRFYSKNADFDLVTKHAGVIANLNIPHIYRKKLLDSLLQPVEQELFLAISRWRKELNNWAATIADKNDIIYCWRQIYDQLKQRITDGLYLISILDQERSSDAALAAEEYATFLRSLAIKISNEVNLHSDAKRLIKEARQLAINALFKKQLDGDLQALDRLTIAEDIKTGSDNELLGQSAEKCGESEDQTHPDTKAQDGKKAKPLDPKKHYRVTVSGKQVMIPPECNCCLGKADTKDYTSYEYQTGNTKHTISLALPICRVCANHRLRLNYKIVTLILLTVGAGASWACWLFKVWPFIPVEYFSISTAIIACISYFLSNLILPFKGVDDAHGSSEDSAKMASAYGGTVTFEFSNAGYAALFAISNGAQAKPFSKWRHSRKRCFPLFSKSGFVSLIWAAIILALGLWFYWAGMSRATLYADNGYKHPIILNLGKGSLVYKIPPGISTITVPAATMYATVEDGRGTDEATTKLLNDLEAVPVPLGEYTLNITSSGDWLFNPGRLNSYILKEVKYGYTSRAPQDKSLGNPLLMKIYADYIFTQPPKSISTKSGGEMKSILIHDQDVETFDVPKELHSLKAGLESKQQWLEQEKKQLSEMETRIENYKKRTDEIIVGGYVPDHMKNEYNWLVDRSNQEIDEYNDRLNKLKKTQDEYNSQVKQYNSKL